MWVLVWNLEFCVNDSEFEFGVSLKFHPLRFYLDVILDGSTFDSG